jgi:outer membrane protein assembly factor BamB
MNRRAAIGVLTTAILTGCLGLEETEPRSEQSQDGNDTSVPRSTETDTPDDSASERQNSTGWTFESESPLSGPALGAERVYIGSLDQTLYAIDSESGEVDWTVESSEFESTGYDFGTPLLAGDYIYARSNREVLRIERSNGEVVGQLDSGFVTGTTELVVTSGGPGAGITAYDPANDTPIWQSDVQPLGKTYVPVLGDDIVVFGSVFDYVDAPDADRDKDTRVFALDRDSGEKLWHFTPDKFVGRSIGVAFGICDGTVAIADEEGAIFAVDATDGSIFWKQDIDRRGSGSLAPQPTMFDDVLLFATGDIYAVDTETGDIQWTISREAINVTDFPPVRNNEIWIPTGDYFEPSKLISVDISGEVQNEYEFSTGYEKLPVIGTESFYIGHTDQTLRKYSK